MRQLFLSLSFLCALLLIGSAYADAEKIIHFASDIRILPDNTITVTETISMYVSDATKLTYFIRTLPLHLSLDSATTDNLDYRVSQILLNNVPITYDTKMANDTFVIHMNHAIKAPGFYIFVLTYQVNHAVLNLADTKKLIWHITGYDFNFPILNAEADVTLPNSVTVLNYSADTRLKDKEARSALARKVSDNQFAFTTKTQLLAHENFILSINWRVKKGAETVSQSIPR